MRIPTGPGGTTVIGVMSRTPPHTITKKGFHPIVMGKAQINTFWHFVDSAVGVDAAEELIRKSHPRKVTYLAEPQRNIRVGGSWELFVEWINC